MPASRLTKEPDTWHDSPGGPFRHQRRSIPLPLPKVKINGRTVTLGVTEVSFKGKPGLYRIEKIEGNIAHVYGGRKNYEAFHSVDMAAHRPTVHSKVGKMKRPTPATFSRVMRACA